MPSHFRRQQTLNVTVALERSIYVDNVIASLVEALTAFTVVWRIIISILRVCNAVAIEPANQLHLVLLQGSLSHEGVSSQLLDNMQQINF